MRSRRVGRIGGAYDEALSEVQRALTMEPSSPHLQLLFARVLVHSGEYDQAILSLSNLVEADGSFYISRRYRAQAYLLQGQPEPAIGDLLLLRAQEQSEDPSFRLPMLGRAYADCGDKRRAQDIHKSLVAMAASSYVVCWNLALSAIGIGKNEEAMTWLERAYEEREPTLLFQEFAVVQADRRRVALQGSAGKDRPVRGDRDARGSGCDDRAQPGCDSGDEADDLAREPACGAVVVGCQDSLDGVAATAERRRA